MFQVEVLIIEIFSIYAQAASAISLKIRCNSSLNYPWSVTESIAYYIEEITTLDHEILDNSVELGGFVACR